MNPNSLARALRTKSTWAEKKLWAILRDRRFSAYKFRRQHKVGQHYLDFFCAEARYNLELDGRQHGLPERQAQDRQARAAHPGNVQPAKRVRLPTRLKRSNTPAGDHPSP